MPPGSNFNIFLGVKRRVKANVPGHGQLGRVDIQVGSRAAEQASVPGLTLQRLCDHRLSVGLSEPGLSKLE